MISRRDPERRWVDPFRPHQIWTALAIVAIVLGCWFQLGAVPLFDLDEGAFSEAAREMVVSGNYLTTTVNGQPFYDKPILTFWLQAIAIRLFGVHEAAFRLPSALASSAWILAVYLFVRRRLGGRVGAMTAFMMATSLQITIIAKAAIADALLNLFIVLSMGGIFLFLEDSSSNPRRRYVRAAAVCMGLGFLTKGPVAIAIPVAASLVFAMVRRKAGRWMRGASDPIAMAMLLAIAASWYLIEYRAYGPDFMRAFLFKHNIGRVGQAMEGHRGPVFYYIPVVLFGLLPFTALLVRAACRAGKMIRDDLLLFGAIWFGIVFVFFSLSATKLPHYLIYGTTPLFLWMALTISAERRFDVPFLVPGLAFFCALYLLPDIAAGLAPRIRDDFARTLMREAPGEFGPGYRLYFATAAAVTLGLMFARRWDPGVKIVVVGLLAVIGVNGMVIPAYARLTQVPIREAAALARGTEKELAIWGIDAPSFLVYTGRFARAGPPRPGEVVITRTSRIGHSWGSFEILYEKHGIVLAEAR
jgi:4-amino-4-deoxy-L-arabinose transferase-like glycosyltransferase